jgi:hypothetical protein
MSSVTWIYPTIVQKESVSVGTVFLALAIPSVGVGVVSPLTLTAAFVSTRTKNVLMDTRVSLLTALLSSASQKTATA